MTYMDVFVMSLSSLDDVTILCGSGAQDQMVHWALMDLGLTAVRPMGL